MTLRSRVLLSLRFLWSVPIILYQRVVSPWLPRRCIYYPTCSSYARKAIARHGVVSGTILAGARILRCTGIFFQPGYDPVPEETSFKVLVDGYRTFRKRR
ncbi:MAG: membrane protein insertion efficiency factor YidD [Spirochaetota bacterium]